MTPRPWSYSSLSSFENCPRAFSEVRIYKTVEEVKGQATVWGEQVHKHFEDRLRDGVVLPQDLAVHEPFMLYLESLPGEAFIEQKIALNQKLRSCSFFDEDVWYRGVIDYMKVYGGHARLCDYKTGKHHSKFGQLKLFALHTFVAHPSVMEIRAEYYWTQTRSTNGETYHRNDIPKLWHEFVPALRQYAEAFRDEIWQPRQSGLCKAHCAVSSCEFNGLGRRRR